MYSIYVQEKVKSFNKNDFSTELVYKNILQLLPLKQIFMIRNYCQEFFMNCSYNRTY